MKKLLLSFALIPLVLLTACGKEKKGFVHILGYSIAFLSQQQKLFLATKIFTKRHQTRYQRPNTFLKATRLRSTINGVIFCIKNS